MQTTVKQDHLHTNTDRLTQKQVEIRADLRLLVRDDVTDLYPGHTRVPPLVGQVKGQDGEGAGVALCPPVFDHKLWGG